MKLDDKILSKFNPVKSIYNKENITSIDFHTEGSLLAVGYDLSLEIYNCHNAELCSKITLSKYGCANVKTVAAKNCLLHSSLKLNHDVRYLQLNTNQYLRYFSGHTDFVYDVVPSMTDDTFLTLSLDSTIKFWDLRNPRYNGEIDLLSYPNCTSINSSGLVFSTISNGNKINMFDIRKYNEGPFKTFFFETQLNLNKTNYNQNYHILSLESSLDDKYLVVALVNETDILIHSFDSFSGELLKTKEIPIPSNLTLDKLKNNFDQFSNQSYSHLLRSGMEFCLSANSEFILGFYPIDDDSSILSGWNIMTDKDISFDNFNISKNNKVLEHADKNEKWISSFDNCHLKANPTYMMLATSYNNILSLWQPLL